MFNLVLCNNIILHYIRKATLPMELEIGSQVVDPVVEGLEEDVFEGIEGKMNAMLKEVMFRKAKYNVLSAQERYKKDYNKKRKMERVRFLFLL